MWAERTCQATKDEPSDFLSWLRGTFSTVAREWQEIQVLDVNGKRLMHQEGEQIRLYMGHLREGLYLVRVKTDQGIGVEKVWKGPGKR